MCSIYLQASFTSFSHAHLNTPLLQKYPGGHLTIYYGSQTGTAEMFAKQLASESENRGFHPRIVDLQDVVDNDDELVVAGDTAAPRGDDGGDTAAAPTCSSSERRW